MAERVGFEPTVPETGTTVFETAAFNRSATSPRVQYSMGMRLSYEGRGALLALTPHGRLPYHGLVDSLAV